jgi:hypothetical protein
VFAGHFAVAFAAKCGAPRAFVQCAGVVLLLLQSDAGILPRSPFQDGIDARRSRWRPRPGHPFGVCIASDRRR